MALGIEALITDDRGRALNIVQELDRLNRERRAIEADMQDDAVILLEDLDPGNRASLCLFDASWHQGVVGILAGRVKERHHRPTFAFARGGAGEVKGSGRSIPGLHLRDALDLVDRRLPGVILKYGGHAAAAGLTLQREHLGVFTDAFETVARESLSAADLTRIIETDGELAPAEFTLANAEALRDAVWGQGFPAPAFHGEFTVQSQRLVGEKHLKLRLASPGITAEAMRFFQDTPLPERIQAVYRLEVNEWNGVRSLQINVGHWAEAGRGPAAKPRT